MPPKKVRVSVKKKTPVPEPLPEPVSEMDYGLHPQLEEILMYLADNERVRVSNGDEIGVMQTALVDITKQLSSVQLALTAIHETLAGKVDGLTAVHETLAGKVDGLTAVHETLAGKVDGLTAVHETLAEKVNVPTPFVRKQREYIRRRPARIPPKNKPQLVVKEHPVLSAVKKDHATVVTTDIKEDTQVQAEAKVNQEVVDLKAQADVKEEVAEVQAEAEVKEEVAEVKEEVAEVKEEVADVKEEVAEVVKDPGRHLALDSIDAVFVVNVSSYAERTAENVRTLNHSTVHVIPSDKYLTEVDRLVREHSYTRVVVMRDDMCVHKKLNQLWEFVHEAVAEEAEERPVFLCSTEHPYFARKNADAEMDLEFYRLINEDLGFNTDARLREHWRSEAKQHGIPGSMAL